VIGLFWFCFVILLFAGWLCGLLVVLGLLCVLLIGLFCLLLSFGVLFDTFACCVLVVLNNDKNWFKLLHLFCCLLLGCFVFIGVVFVDWFVWICLYLRVWVLGFLFFVLVVVLICLLVWFWVCCDLVLLVLFELCLVLLLWLILSFVILWF